MFRLALPAALLGALATSFAYASDVQARAEIPFDFVVRGTLHPAGNYTFRNVQWGTGSPVYAMRNEATSRSNLLMTAHAATRTEGQRVDTFAVLEFACAEETCQLVALWPAGETTGQRFAAEPLRKIEDVSSTVKIAMSPMRTR